MSRSDDSRMPVRRRRLSWRFYAVLAVVLAFLPLVSFGFKLEYCCRCGLERHSFGISVGCGHWRAFVMALSSSERQTPLSEAVLPLFGAQGCSHEWVPFLHWSVLQDLASEVFVTSEGAYRAQRNRVIYGSHARALVEVSRVDPELALASLRTVLFPYTDPEDFHKEYRRFIDLLFIPIGVDAEEHARFRRLYGLPPKARDGCGKEAP